MKRRNDKGRELLPLAVSGAVQTGDAVKPVLRYYEGYMNRLCTRTVYDESGCPHACLDEYMKSRRLYKSDNGNRESGTDTPPRFSWFTSFLSSYYCSFPLIGLVNRPGQAQVGKFPPPCSTKCPACPGCRVPAQSPFARVSGCCPKSSPQAAPRRTYEIHLSAGQAGR